MIRLVISILFTLYAMPALCADVYSVSKSDVNRFVFPNDVEDIIFSEEKGLITKTVGKELFVKFPVQIAIDQNTQESTITYADKNTELYVIAGGVTYNFVLQPENIASKNITIASLEEPEPIIVQEARDSEELLANLIKVAIENDYPKSAKQQEINKTTKQMKGNVELIIVHSKSTAISDFIIKEFHIYAPENVTLLPAELVSFDGVSNVLATSILAEQFNGWVRAFVVERK